MRNWQAMAIRPDASLADAITIIDAAGGQIAIVTDENFHLLGVLTDADLRKAMVRQIPLTSPCSTVMTPNPIRLPASAPIPEQLELMRRRHVRQLPLVDGDNRVVDVALLLDMVVPQALPNPVVIMAGGLGSRLGDLTLHVPKPLLQVGDRPLLETIVLQLVAQGFVKFYFAVNYHAEKIIEHFGDGSRWGISVEYLREKERLGTAGALHLLPDNIEEEIFVMNGDILTKVDLRHMLATHKTYNASVTLAVKDFVLTVPYGVVKLDDHSTVTGFEEKPNQRFFVNAGIYVIRPDVLKYVPKGQYFDMPSLFTALGDRGHKISAFPLREYWLDIGHPEDYEQANQEYVTHFP